MRRVRVLPHHEHLIVVLPADVHGGGAVPGPVQRHRHVAGPGPQGHRAHHHGAARLLPRRLVPLHLLEWHPGQGGAPPSGQQVQC